MSDGSNSRTPLSLAPGLLGGGCPTDKYKKPWEWPPFCNLSSGLSRDGETETSSGAFLTLWGSRGVGVELIPHQEH